MIPAKATRFLQAVFASLAVYLVGAVLIYRVAFALHGDHGASEWPERDVRAFLAVFASYPLATVAVSAILARRFGAPALATAAVTASGIAIIWSTFWLILR